VDGRGVETILDLLLLGPRGASVPAAAAHEGVVSFSTPQVTERHMIWPSWLRMRYNWAQHNTPWIQACRSGHASPLGASAVGVGRRVRFVDARVQQRQGAGEEGRILKVEYGDRPWQVWFGPGGEWHGHVERYS